MESAATLTKNINQSGKKDVSVENKMGKEESNRKESSELPIVSGVHVFAQGRTCSETQKIMLDHLKQTKANVDLKESKDTNDRNQQKKSEKNNIKTQIKVKKNQNGLVVEIIQSIDGIHSIHHEILVKAEPALIKVPGIKGDIVVQSDGSFVLGKLTSQANLVLSTHANIVVTEPIQAANLALHAQDITVHNTINATGDLILKTESTLKNFHSLQANRIKICGQGHLRDEGLIKSKEQLNIKVNTTDNQGAIISDFIKVRSEISDPKKTTNNAVHDKFFNNSGVVLGVKKCIFESDREITNSSKGEILSYGNITIETPHRFINNSQVVAKGTLHIDAIHRVVQYWSPIFGRENGT